jgi:Holliday junction DNA helicase RuvB
VAARSGCPPSREETETVETVAEPYLVREGLLVRTPRGRAATPAAWQHVGLTAPRGAPGAADQGLLPFGPTNLGGDTGRDPSGDTTGRLG